MSLSKPMRLKKKRHTAVSPSIAATGTRLRSGRILVSRSTPLSTADPPPRSSLRIRCGSRTRLNSVVPTSVSEAKSPKSRSSCESVKSSPAKAPMVVMLPIVSG